MLLITIMNTVWGLCNLVYPEGDLLFCAWYPLCTHPSKGLRFCRTRLHFALMINLEDSHTVILSLSHGFMSYGFIDNLRHVY